MKKLAHLRSFAFLLSLAATSLAACGSNVPRILSTLTPITSNTSSNPITTRTQPEIITPIPPTETPTATAIPKPAWQQTVETQDNLDKFFKIIDGHPVGIVYDTNESIIFNENSITKTVTTDINSPEIITAQRIDTNDKSLYAFNPDHGWFKIPETQMNYANLKKYTGVDEDSFYDGQHNIIRALSYANSTEKNKISKNSHPIFWITAEGTNHMLFLSSVPVGHLGEAIMLWPTEYNNYFSDHLSGYPNFVFSDFYKVNLKAGGYIYVIDRTIKIDDTHTSGLSNGFDKATYEAMNIEYPNSPGWTPLRIIFEEINKGMKDFVTFLPPPEQFADGTPISFNPNNITLGNGNGADPIVASLQGPRGSLIKLLSETDQQRISDVLTANEHYNNNILDHIIAPLADPSYLAKLADHILLTGVGDK